MALLPENIRCQRQLAPQQAAEEDFARQKSLLLRFGRKKRFRLLGGANGLLLIFKNRACLLRLVLPGNQAKGIVHGFILYWANTPATPRHSSSIPTDRSIILR